MLNQRIAHALSLFDGILRTHANFINSVGLEMSKEDKNLSYLHWTPKLHKTLFKHHFLLPTAVNAQLKTLSYHITKVLSAIKEGWIRYCPAETSCNGLNNM